MNLFEQITRWLGLSNHNNAEKDLEELQAFITRSQQHKYKGEYTAALGELDQADDLAAQKSADAALKTFLAVQRADVLLRQGQPEQADATLKTIPIETDALALVTAGMIAQARGEWENARECYEQALAVARAAKSVSGEGIAQGHMADTYLREDNLSFSQYLLQEALPKINLSGDVERSGYFAGRLGETLIRLEQPREGQRYLGRALRLAEQIEHQAYELRWRRILAVQAMAEGLYPEARRHYMLLLAHSDAAEPEYPLTLCRLSKTCLRLSEYDAALDYARQAIELTDDETTSENTLRARAAYGIALRNLEQYAEAVTHLQAAVPDYADLELNQADHSYVDVLRNLAAAQAETQDYTTAARTYQQALDYAEAHQEAVAIAGTYRDFGILHTRRGDPKQAIDAWTKALKIYETEGQNARVARLYCDVANIRRQQGQGRRALKDYEQALMLLSSINDLETRGIVLSNAATAYVDQGDIETAESFFVEAIKIAQRTTDRHAEATRRGNYGWFLLSTGRAKRAIATLAYSLRQSENLGMRLQAAVQTDNIGLAHDQLREYEQAIGRHREALAMLDDLDFPHWRTVISTNLGHSLVALGTDDALREAEGHFTPALAFGRANSATEITVRALNGLAKINLKRDNHAQAGEHINEAVSLAKQADLRRLLADALVIRSQQRINQNDETGATADWQEAGKLFEILQIPPENHAPAWIATHQDQ